MPLIEFRMQPKPSDGFSNVVGNTVPRYRIAVVGGIDGAGISITRLANGTWACNESPTSDFNGLLSNHRLPSQAIGKQNARTTQCPNKGTSLNKIHVLAERFPCRIVNR